MVKGELFLLEIYRKGTRKEPYALKLHKKIKIPDMNLRGGTNYYAQDREIYLRNYKSLC